MMAARNVTIAPSARGDAVRIVRPPTPRPARVDPEGLSLEEQAHALLASIEARVGIPAYTHATFGDSASMSMDPDPAPAPAPSYATNTSRFDRFARESNPWAIAATTDHSLNAPSNLLSDATVAPRPFQRHNAFIGSRSPPASPVPAQSLLSRIAPARTSAFGNPTPTPLNQEPAPSHTANAFDRYAQQSNPWAVPSGGAFGEPTPAPEPAPPTFGYTSAIFGDSASASVPLETATPAFAPFATPAPAEGQHQPYQTQQYYAPQQEFSQQSYAQGHGHYFDQSQQQQQQQMHFPPQEMPSVFQPEYTMPQPHQYTSHEPQFLAPPVLSPEQLAYLAAQCTSPADLVELLEHARQLGYLQAEHEYVAALQVLQAHQEYWYQQQCLDQQQGVYQQHEQHETHAPAPSLLFGPAGCPPRRVVVEVECGLTEEELGVEAPAQPEWWAGVAAAQEWHEASDNSGLSYHIESEEEEGDVDVEMDLEENGDYIEEAYVRGQDAEERRAMARVGQAIQANWRNNYMGRPPVRRRTALQERATSSALASFSGQVASTSFSFSDAASSSSSASDLDLGPQPPSPSAHDPSWSDSDSASSEDSEADSDSEEVDNDDGSEYSFSSHSSHSSSGHLTAHPRARTRASPYPRPRSRPARSCRGLIDSMAWLIGRVGA
ncbi:hypothetical protein B0H13DRAFT_2058919 [Mycena leptocephala]|nr:hypothetical protein B0H13DRAFT_2058919 [Mycena leptocephala]